MEAGSPRRPASTTMPRETAEGRPFDSSRKGLEKPSSGQSKTESTRPGRLNQKSLSTRCEAAIPQAQHLLSQAPESGCPGRAIQERKLRREAEIQGWVCIIPRPPEQGDRPCFAKQDLKRSWHRPRKFSDGQVMGASVGKKQVLIYLPIKTHKNLAIESARHELPVSKMIEAALERWSFMGHVKNLRRRNRST